MREANHVAAVSKKSPSSANLAARGERGRRLEDGDTGTEDMRSAAFLQMSDVENRNAVEFEREGENDSSRRTSFERIREVSKPREEGKLLAGRHCVHSIFKRL